MSLRRAGQGEGAQFVVITLQQKDEFEPFRPKNILYPELAIVGPSDNSKSKSSSQHTKKTALGEIIQGAMVRRNTLQDNSSPFQERKAQKPKHTGAIRRLCRVALRRQRPTARAQSRRKPQQSKSKVMTRGYHFLSNNAPFYLYQDWLCPLFNNEQTSVFAIHSILLPADNYRIIPVPCTVAATSLARRYRKA